MLPLLETVQSRRQCRKTLQVMRLQFFIEDSLLLEPERRDDPTSEEGLETESKSIGMEVTKAGRTTEEEKTSTCEKKEGAVYLRCLIFIWHSLFIFN